MFCFFVEDSNAIFASFDAIRAYYKFWGGRPNSVLFGKLEGDGCFDGCFRPTSLVPLKDIWPEDS